MNNPESDDSRTQNLFQSIREKSSQGEYIYRGEPEQYDKISSTLYRKYKDQIQAEQFDILIAQQEMLEQVKAYTDFTDETDVLTELQHYGGKTNLIDFTSDYLTALFFACDGSPDKDGRVILLNKNSNQGKMTSPKKNLNDRIISQKSVFLQSPKGYLDEEDSAVKIVSVPQALKQPVLDYLRKYHGITTHTIYNDIFGYIQNQAKHQTAYAEFYIGLTSYKKGKYEEAVKHYDQAIRINPQNGTTYTNRGAARASLGQHNDAIADYDQAIRLNPQEATTYYNRGNVKGKLGRHKEAIVDFDEAIRLNPQDSESYNNRGTAKARLGRYAAALADFDQAIRMYPQNTAAYFNRGNAKGAIGKYDEAIADLDEAIRMYPHDAKAYCNLGTAKGALGRHDEAIEAFNAAVRIAPELTEAYCGRGVACKGIGEYEKARADLQRALELATEQGNQELAQKARRLMDELPPPASVVPS